MGGLYTNRSSILFIGLTGGLKSNRFTLLLVEILILFKDCLPYLFPGFRNKYFNKTSLDNMLYFQNKL